MYISHGLWKTVHFKISCSSITIFFYSCSELISLFNYSASLNSLVIEWLHTVGKLFYHRRCSEFVPVFFLFFFCSNQHISAKKTKQTNNYLSHERGDKSAEVRGERSRPTAPPGNRSWHIRTISLLRGGRRIKGFRRSVSVAAATPLLTPPSRTLQPISSEN